MRLVIADCEVSYAGRLDAYLPRAKRLIMLKADGSVLIHSDGGSYKPLNWMSPPCQLRALAQEEISALEADPAPIQVWNVSANKSEDCLTISIYEIFAEVNESLGVDPGLIKDGVEAHLQKLLAEKVEVLGEKYRLMRREYPTPIGPVDLLVRDENGKPVAVEVKRRGEIDGVEQLTRYLQMLKRDVNLREITGIFAAQEIKPQARVLAEDRGIRCVILDYDDLRGIDNSANRLF